MRIVVRYFWVMLLFASNNVFAVQVQSLFEVQRLVSDQSEEVRTTAVKDALTEVLVRATGHSASLENEQVLKIIEDAGRFLVQFSYADNPISGLEASNSSNGTAETSVPLRYRLNMRFDENSLLQLLAQSQQSIWGSNRPGTLIWLAIEGNNGRFVVNNENNPLLSEIIQAHGVRRGVPMMLPLMDLEDEQRVSVSDIWGQFSDRISAASVRYSPDAIMMGRIYRASPEQWVARWRLQVGSQDFMVDLESEQLRDLLALSSDWLAESLASQYAVSASVSGPDSYQFKVLGVRSTADYAQLNAYLTGLQIVDAVEVVQFDQGALQYQVKIKGAVKQFLSVLALESYLQVDRSEAGQGRATFYWRKR